MPLIRYDLGVGEIVRRRIRSSLAALAVAALPLSQAWGACYTAVEATAVHVKMLQYDLMVGALACRDINPELGMMQQYNAFITRNSDWLVGHSRILQGHFQKHYGPQHKRHLDTLVTALANDASKRSMTDRFCDSAATLFREVSNLDRRGLDAVSNTRASLSSTSITQCTGETSSGVSIRR
ncbi:MAG: hypothetical protein FJX55_16535 [Alphaproteobacteria bacterium]|nr:hypothetical protein [Alphaproteobacteria bacterium]